MADLDFKGLADYLLSISEQICYEWIPGGHMEGKEYCAGSEAGGPGNSFKVNTLTGAFCDFANESVKGGDFIALWATLHGLKQGEAFRELADRYNQAESAPAPRPVPKKEPTIIAPPLDAPPPDMTHAMYREPTASWVYKDIEGRPLFYVARYDTPAEKLYFPFSWCSEDRWIMKGWPEPRPLYGLELLTGNPGKPILIVEGEKACEAARKLIGEAYLVVTWSHGTQSYSKTDWLPLSGRNILIWPDADTKIVKTDADQRTCGTEIGTIKPYAYQPGPMAALGIAQILAPLCREVKLLDVGIDPDRVDGWDAADALEAGWDFNLLVEWAKPRANIYKQAEKSTKKYQNVQIVKKERPHGKVHDATIVEKLAEPPLLGTIRVEASEDTPKQAAIVSWEELGLACSSQGNPYTNVDNAIRALENHPPFKDIVWFDEFHKRFFTRWGGGMVREWQDVDTLNLTTYFQKEIGLHKLSDDIIYKAIVVYGYRHTKNEPRDWFDTLKWDEKPRIDRFLTDCLGAADTDYIKAASKNFWLGMVARVYRPGCQLDNMIVLEGAQGIGKTQALKAIGGSWYTAVHESVQRKDFFMVLHGRLIIEIEELDSFNRADVTRIKQVVSCSTDRFRTPYARLAEDHKRMSIFVGSTNEQTYLRDTTGGRRFWPVRCGDISKDRIQDEREQLFAEAIHRFKVGENWYVMPHGETKKEQEDRRYVDEWESIIGGYLIGKSEITVHELAGNLSIGTDRLDTITQRRISTILRGLGWCKKSILREGVAMRLWYPAEIPYTPELPIETTPPAENGVAREEEPIDEPEVID